jgi:hypothetical protein
MLEDLTSGTPRVLWPGRYGDSGSTAIAASTPGSSAQTVRRLTARSSLAAMIGSSRELYEIVLRLRYTEVAETTRKLEEVLQRVVARRNSGS